MATRRITDPDTLDVVCPNKECEFAAGLIQKDKRPTKYTGTDWPILFRPVHHYTCGCCHTDFTVRMNYFQGGYTYIQGKYMPAWQILGLFGASFVCLFLLIIHLLSIPRWQTGVTKKGYACHRIVLEERGRDVKYTIFEVDPVQVLRMPLGTNSGPGPSGAPDYIYRDRFDDLPNAVRQKLEELEQTGAISIPELSSDQQPRPPTDEKTEMSEEEAKATIIGVSIMVGLILLFGFMGLAQMRYEKEYYEKYPDQRPPHRR